MLPKKWCVKITPESINKLNLWRDDKGLLSKSYHNRYVVSYNKGKKGYCQLDIEDYIEISFEDFKKYVLKGQPEEYISQIFN